jgi:hypothetical protein
MWYGGLFGKNDFQPSLDGDLITPTNPIDRNEDSKIKGCGGLKVLQKAIQRLSRRGLRIVGRRNFVKICTDPICKMSPRRSRHGLESDVREPKVLEPTAIPTKVLHAISWEAKRGVFRFVLGGMPVISALLSHRLHRAILRAGPTQIPASSDPRLLARIDQNLFCRI